MIRYCNIFKNYIYEVKAFRVFWSKRGYWTASSEAGKLPGAGRGCIESNGESIGEAVANLEAALIARQGELNQKLKEVEAALMEVRSDGYLAEELESVATRKGKELVNHN